MEFTTQHLFNSDNPKPQFKPTNNYGCLVLVVLVSLLIFSKCKSKGEGGIRATASDSLAQKLPTVRDEEIQLEYYDPYRDTVLNDFCLIVINDSAETTATDTLGKDADGGYRLKQVKKYYSDTMYFKPVYGRGWDTLVFSDTKKPVIDLFGKIAIRPFWERHPKDLIGVQSKFKRSFWFHDSVIKKPRDWTKNQK